MDVERFERVSAQQQVLRGDTERLQAWCDRHPTRTGGLWLDSTAAEAGTGHVQVVVTTVADDGATHELLGLVEHPEHLRVVPVAHALAELRRVADEVRGLGLPGVSGVGTDLVGNRVRLHLAAPDAAVEAELDRRYPQDLLDVRVGVVVVTSHARTTQEDA